MTQNNFYKALQCTTSLLEKVPPKSVCAAGSAVMLKFDNEIFLVSIAHLLNATTWPLLTIPAKDNSMINLQGRLITTMPEGGTQYMDFSILKFSENMHKYLIGYYDFVSLERIKFNYLPSPSDKLLFTGYPISKTIKKSENEYDAIPFKFETNPKPDKIYENEKLEKGCFLISEYRKRISDKSGKKKFCAKFDRHKWLRYMDS